MTLWELVVGPCVRCENWQDQSMQLCKDDGDARQRCGGSWYDSRRQINLQFWLFHDSNIHLRIFYLIQENPVLRFDIKTFLTKAFASESFGAVSHFYSQFCNIEAKIYTQTGRKWACRCPAGAQSGGTTKDPSHPWGNLDFTHPERSTTQVWAPVCDRPLLKLWLICCRTNVTHWRRLVPNQTSLTVDWSHTRSISEPLNMSWLHFKTLQRPWKVFF